MLRVAKAGKKSEKLEQANSRPHVALTVQGLLALHKMGRARRQAL